MYAIRSYYAPPGQGTSAATPSTHPLSSGYVATESSTSRITSYNVCYTKLLRAVVLTFLSFSVVAFAVAIVGLCWLWWQKIAHYFS